MTQAERFWAKVARTPSRNECWLWSASLDRYGYGRFRLGGRTTRTVSAHRFAYETCVGSIPDGLFVMHSCDMPRCCNPSHLSLGTQQDNQADKVSKDRQARGYKNAKTKLSASDKINIRTLRFGGIAISAIAAAFDCCNTTIRNVLREGH